MKTHGKAFAAAAVVTILFAGIGTALAGGKSPVETGRWEYREALETGSLAAGPQNVLRTKNAAEAAEVPVVKSSGIVYRVGLDTF